MFFTWHLIWGGKIDWFHPKPVDIGLFLKSLCRVPYPKSNGSKKSWFFQQNLTLQIFMLRISWFRLRSGELPRDTAAPAEVWCTKSNIQLLQAPPKTLKVSRVSIETGWSQSLKIKAWLLLAMPCFEIFNRVLDQVLVLLESMEDTLMDEESLDMLQHMILFILIFLNYFWCPDQILFLHKSLILDSLDWY